MQTTDPSRPPCKTRNRKVRIFPLASGSLNGRHMNNPAGPAFKDTPDPSRRAEKVWPKKCVRPCVRVSDLDTLRGCFSGLSGFSYLEAPLSCYGLADLAGQRWENHPSASGMAPWPALQGTWRTEPGAGLGGAPDRSLSERKTVLAREGFGCCG